MEETVTKSGLGDGAEERFNWICFLQVGLRNMAARAQTHWKPTGRDYLVYTEFLHGLLPVSPAVYSLLTRLFLLLFVYLFFLLIHIHIFLNAWGFPAYRGTLSLPFCDLHRDTPLVIQLVCSPSHFRDLYLYKIMKRNTWMWGYEFQGNLKPKARLFGILGKLHSTGHIIPVFFQSNVLEGGRTDLLIFE